jgi:hypothetical protein
MTTVVPILTLLAGNMNNKLLPAPVPIMTKIGLLFFIIARNTDSYNLRNAAPSLYIRSNSSWILTPRNHFHLATYASYISSSYAALFRFNRPPIPTPACADRKFN